MSRTRLSPEEMRRLLGETVVDRAEIRQTQSPQRSALSFQAQSVPAPRTAQWRWILLAVFFGAGSALWLAPLLQGQGQLAPNGIENTVAPAHQPPQTVNQQTPALTGNSTPEAAVLDASGYVNAARVATVSAVTTGRLLEVLVDEGSRVEKGQLLARLDAADIQRQVALAEAQLQSAKTMAEQQKVQLAEAQEQLQRIQSLHQQGFVSEDALKTAQYNVSRLQVAQTLSISEITVSERRLSIQQQQFNNTYIYAPFAGLVVERAAEVGEIVSPVSAGGGFTRTGIFTLADTSAMEAHVKVNENYINRVHRGQTVLITPRSYPELRLRGEVSMIMPVAERETASVKVIVTFLETDERVLPNMSVDLSFGEMSDAASARTNLADGSKPR